MTVNIHEAKTHFSKILNRVIMGEEVVIAKAGRPVARLCPYESGVRKRVGGRDRGMFRVPADFDAPLPEELLADFIK